MNVNLMTIILGNKQYLNMFDPGLPLNRIDDFVFNKGAKFTKIYVCPKIYFWNIQENTVLVWRDSIYGAKLLPLTEELQLEFTENGKDLNESAFKNGL